MIDVLIEIHVRVISNAVIIGMNLVIIVAIVNVFVVDGVPIGIWAKNEHREHGVDTINREQLAKT
jgi:hypothetical protein